MSTATKPISISIDENTAREILEEDSERFEIVEEGDWVDDGKYSLREIIVKDTTTGKHYSADYSRSGSYYTDYEINYPDVLYEVVAQERVITEWVVVKA